MLLDFTRSGFVSFGETACLKQGSTACGPIGILCSSSCSSHLLAILISVLLLISFLINVIIKVLGRRNRGLPLFSSSSPLKIACAALNGSLGFVYMIVFVWMLGDQLLNGRGSSPLHSWLVLLSMGLICLTAGLMSSMRVALLGTFFSIIWSAALTLFAVFLCVSFIFDCSIVKKPSVKLFLDIISLPGACLLLLSVIKELNVLENSTPSNRVLYEPLKPAPDGNIADFTPFANAGFFSKMSFWWLNPLMKKGYKKPLEEKDIPLLGREDQAERCFSLFVDQMSKQKRRHTTASPSVLRATLACHLDQILISGFFALLKVLTLSAGPMLLNSFIKVSLGKGNSRYEGFILAVALFLSKVLESVSQRQWYFRTRRLGMQVRSLLSAAIYQKQLRLSNAAKLSHSSGEITNYVTVDAYRIGEFPFWFHQTWSTSFQLCLALLILYNAVGLATLAAMLVIVLTVLCNVPLAKLQHKFQSKLMDAQDERLKAVTEALVNMKVLKLYAWESHFKNVIKGLRDVECKWLKAFQLRRAYNSFLFWSSPVLVSAATFSTCYFLHIPLNASNVFTFVATLRLVQDPVRQIPDVIGVVIQAKVAFARIVKFLEVPELQSGHSKRRYTTDSEHPIVIESASFSWDENFLKPTLREVNLKVSAGEKVAICGEVGSEKSSLLAAVLGEIPKTEGMVQVCGKIAYVSQNAWIQTGTVRENILFGSTMDEQKYQETLRICSLVKDIEMLPFGDLTEIGERGVNLSGGQKQRVQLARALYQNADIYLLDDPFSAVDAHTATSLFQEYVMAALSSKTVLLVTHQVDFLPEFGSILLMSDGEVLCGASYHELLAFSKEFRDLVNAHKDTVGAERLDQLVSDRTNPKSRPTFRSGDRSKQLKTERTGGGGQLIKKEERETGNTGLKPYLQYLNQNKGFLFFSLAALSHAVFLGGQVAQNSWMAAKVQDPEVGILKLIVVYLAIGVTTLFFLLTRSISVVVLGIMSSTSLFSELLNSLFSAPMSFFDSTPLGRILSRVSSDLSIVDLDVPFALIFSVSATLNAYSSLGVLSAVTWPVLFVAILLVCLTICLQRYYLASAKELMRINGTTKSMVANHLTESISGAITIRAFEKEDRFFAKSLVLIDRNASPYFHSFAASEWLIQRLETMSAAIISSSALVMALLPPGTFSPGLVGLALSYGLSLNMSLVFSIQNQCTVANYIISVERINQYMHVSREAPEVIESNRPTPNWPAVGRVEVQDLQIRYRPDTPLVLRGISCIFEGGHKIGIVGRTGSGKTTLIGALFRLVEPAGGRILIDCVDITKIGLHDLRSRLGIIPQDPTLFHGSVRYNLDPLSQHTDQQIWEVYNIL
ncbi:ABC transporter C family member 10 [Apostasia shenzhenica]|uniref:ABC transporter C family member 10 n=1 Tax=Apostasia shenzhenica TaxID=1088818 RepID=A0A2I0ATU2_9ASPA|nr:ABC transporter C family member 10 [Apostasia shenzhenica]